MSSAVKNRLLQYHVTSAKAVMWFCQKKKELHSQKLGKVGCCKIVLLQTIISLRYNCSPYMFTLKKTYTIIQLSSMYYYVNLVANDIFYSIFLINQRD